MKKNKLLKNAKASDKYITKNGLLVTVVCNEGDGLVKVSLEDGTPYFVSDSGTCYTVSHDYDVVAKIVE